MKKKAKTYPINQSPLFKIYSLNRLAKCLGISRSQLNFLEECDNNYLEFNKIVRGKVREIQAPKPLLEKVHCRLFDLIRRIETPDYLHSGITGRSYISNARAHDPNLCAFKLDIKSFYPNTKTEHVYKAFRHDFECSHVVALSLSHILTVHGHVPTGSSVSQCLAYWVHRNMFDRLAAACQRFDGHMTVYVDDIFVSSGVVRKRRLRNFGRIINQHGLEWHKERVYRANMAKYITGVIRHPCGTRLPNSKHHKLMCTYENLSITKDSKQRLRLARSISGQLSTASQLDKSLTGKMNAARGYQKHLSKL